MSNTPWYNKTGLVVLTLFLFFPIGLYALWKNDHIGKGWKIGVSVFYALIIIAALAGDKNPKTTTQEIAAVENPAPEPVKPSYQRFTSNELTQYYEANEVSADQNFKGKTFEVEGTVGDIKKDILDNIYVILKAGSEYDLRDVQCYLNDESIAASLSKGQMIVIRGTCDGLMMNVQMKDCEVVE